MAANGINSGGGGGGGGCHFDIESGTFKGKFNTLMWPSRYFDVAFQTSFYFCFTSLYYLWYHRDGYIA